MDEGKTPKVLCICLRRFLAIEKFLSVCCCLCVTPRDTSMRKSVILWITFFRMVVADLNDGVNIFSISNCGDIAEVGISTITVPAAYPSAVTLLWPRSCRFVVQSQTAPDNSPGTVELTAVLEHPFDFGPKDYIVFMDGSLVRNSDPCTTADQSSLVMTANSTQYGTMGREFTVRSTSLVIDFCSGGSPVPVRFMISSTRSVKPPVVLPTTAVEEITDPSIGLADPAAEDVETPYAVPPQIFEQPAIVQSLAPEESVAPECGQTNQPPDQFTRIINGIEAKPGNFPWAVAMVHKKFKHFCGGSILNAQWIVTAAHCVIGPLELRDIIANTSIVTGVLNLKDMTADNSYAIDQIAVHPQYEPKGWLNDIAVIKLKVPIKSLTAPGGPRAVCMPKRTLEDVNLSQSFYGRNVTCYLAGWGYTKEAAGIPVLTQSVGSGASFADAANGNNPTAQVGAGSDALLYAKLDYVPLETCQRNYQVGGMVFHGVPGFVRDNMVCASNEKARQGACLGDSGGGLYCKELDDSWGVYGASSWSGGCARKDLPSVFANVYELRTFIERALTRKPPPPRVPTRSG